MTADDLRRAMKNERGGFIATIFIIPIGLVLMIGIFFLGYYVGKYKSKPDETDVVVVPLPEIVSENIPKKEEFTFFKTLTDRENKTVSIELKPTREEAPVPQKKENKPEPKAAKAETTEKKPDRTPSIVKAPEAKRDPARKEPVITRSPGPTVRYTLQIASYQEKDMAEADVKKMKQHGYAAFVTASEIEGKGTWYRVRLGSFSSRASAEKLQKEIRTKQGITPFITIE
jgi:cell division protein FtsN